MHEVDLLTQYHHCIFLSLRCYLHDVEEEYSSSNQCHDLTRILLLYCYFVLFMLHFPSLWEEGEVC